MKVNEYIDETKKSISMEAIKEHLSGLTDYARDNYSNAIGCLDKEYAGDYSSMDEDPWITDIVVCKAAIGYLNLLEKSVEHIVNAEDEMALEVLRELGFTDENLEVLGQKELIKENKEKETMKTRESMDITNNNKRKVVCRSNEDLGGMMHYGYNAPLLKVGEQYTVDSVDVHDWYTIVTIEEIPGTKFNSVCFTEV